MVKISCHILKYAPNLKCQSQSLKKFWWSTKTFCRPNGLQKSDSWKSELWKVEFSKYGFVGQMAYKFFHQSEFVGHLAYKINFRKINLSKCIFSAVGICRPFGLQKFFVNHQNFFKLSDWHYKFDAYFEKWQDIVTSFVHQFYFILAPFLSIWDSLTK